MSVQDEFSIASVIGSIKEIEFTIEEYLMCFSAIVYSDLDSLFVGFFSGFLVCHIFEYIGGIIVLSLMCIIGERRN